MTAGSAGRYGTWQSKLPPLSPCAGFSILGVIRQSTLINMFNTWGGGRRTLGQNKTTHDAFADLCLVGERGAGAA